MVAAFFLEGAAYAADAAGEAGAEAAGTLPQLMFETWPSQVFWLLVTFFVLYLALSRSLLPRIGSVIEDRHDKIADDLDDAARFKKHAETAAASYERTLADARAKAHAIAAETRADIDAQIARETAEADAEAAKRAEDAETRIRASAEEALASAQTVAADAAAEIVAKLTGAAPSRAAVEAAANAASAKD